MDMYKNNNKIDTTTCIINVGYPPTEHVHPVMNTCSKTKKGAPLGVSHWTLENY